MISIMLVLPALLRVCFSVDFAVTSASRMFSPSWKRRDLKDGIELVIEWIMTNCELAGCDRHGG